MTDGDFFLVSAVAIAALTALLAASKRWNPGHDSDWDWFRWPYLKAGIQLLGYGLVIAGLAGLLVRSTHAIAYLGAGAVLIATRYVVGLLFRFSGEEEDL